MTTTPTIFGGNTGLSYEELQARKRIADELLMRKPQITNVGEGIRAATDALVGGFQRRQADREDQRQQSEFNASLGSFGGGGATGGGYGLGSGYSAPGGAESMADGGGSVFLSLMDRKEGGGSYDTLFGHSQREGGQFAGVRPSQMTIAEAAEFSSPSGAYGQWVKGQVGRVATPMGRYQIVGTTLRNAAKEMGLDPNTPFNAQTQDAIATHLARRRLAGASSQQAKRAAMRAEWEGFKTVPDAKLDMAIAEIESGGGFGGAVQTAEGRPSEYGDPATAAQATPAVAGSYGGPAGAEQAMPNQMGARANPVQYGQQRAQLVSVIAEAQEIMNDPRFADAPPEARQRVRMQAMMAQDALEQLEANQLSPEEQERMAIQLERERLGLEKDRLALEQAQNPQPEQPKPTDDMREYEFARSQGFEGSFMDFQNAMAQQRRAQTNVNVSTGEPGPRTGTIPQGYTLIEDDSSPAGYRMVPIPGGPEDTTKTDAAAAEQRRTSTNLVLDEIGIARDLVAGQEGLNRTTGPIGAVLSRIDSTRAGQLKNRLETIKANIGFDKLQSMREASPTGGALGAVSEFENRLLQAVHGSLVQSQTAEDLLYNLDRLETLYNRVINEGIPEEEARAMYREISGGQAAPEPQSSIAIFPMPEQIAKMDGTQIADMLRQVPPEKRAEIPEEVLEALKARRAELARLGEVRQ